MFLLDDVLKAKQDDIVRHPIVDLKVGQFNTDIPFDGLRIDDIETDEISVSSVTHTDGRLCIAYLYVTDVATNKRKIRYVYTDPQRKEFTYVDTAAEITNATSQIAICELADGNVGLVWVAPSNKINYMILTVEGVQVATGTIKTGATGDKYSSPALVRQGSEYLLAYLRTVPITVTSGGTYSGQDSATFEIVVTADGTNKTGMFKYRKNVGEVEGAWSADIVMTGSSQALQDGITVVFGAGSYCAGQEFFIYVTPAFPAKGAIWAEGVPANGETITVGGTVYTWRTNLSLPAVPNELKIDTLSKDISMENLRCALTGGTFEGTGEGVRFSMGTVARTDVKAIRNGSRVDLTSVAKGSLVNIVVDDACQFISTEDVTGGKNASVGAVTGVPSTLIFGMRSTDFITWGNEAEIVPGGVVKTRSKHNISLTKLSTGGLMLWFDMLTQGFTDSTAVYNVLYAESADNGATWGDAVQVTQYTSPSVTGKNPKALEKIANEITLVFDEMRSCLRMDGTTQGWDTNEPMTVAALHFNNTTRSLYAVATYTGAGGKYLRGICRINVDTWQITGFWNDFTVPSLPAYMFAETGFHLSSNGMHNEDDYVAVVGYDADYFSGVVCLLNAKLNKVTTYYFQDNKKHNIIKNVGADFTWEVLGQKHQLRVAKCWVDAANDRLWVALHDDDYYGRIIEVGYLDIKQSDDANVTLYNWSQVVYEKNQISEAESKGFGIFNGSLTIVPEAGWVVVNYKATISTQAGLTKVWFIDSGGAYKTFKYTTHPNFPFYGLNACTYYNGKLYGAIDHQTTYANQESLCGLVEIDVASDYIYYYKPGFMEGSNELWINYLHATEDGKIIGAANGFGVVILDLMSGQWACYNNSNVPGLYPGDGSDTAGSYYWGPVTYDPSTGMVFFGNLQESSISGITGFSVYGRLERLHYATGLQAAGWNFGTPVPLVTGQSDSDGSINFEPGTNALYAFWWSYRNGKGAIKWDKETGEFDLKPYLLRGSDVAVKRSINGATSSLTFSLSNGHEFDPHNLRSLYSKYIRKGKRVTLRFGERIGDDDYWQPGESEWVVIKNPMPFKRGDYPVMQVTCEDKRALWDDSKVVATPFYNNALPHNVITDVVKKWGGFKVDNISLTAFDESIPIKVQYLDKYVKDIVTPIAWRFGYFLDIHQGTGALVARKVDLQKAPDHVYTGHHWILDYTPDDTYSDFTNRVTVVGESPDDIMVGFTEERVAGDSGTVGFWKRKDTKRIYFSEDKSRRCMKPRLEVLESATSIAFMLAGQIKERISYIDPEFRYVDIKIEAPDLIPLLVAGLAMYAAGRSMPASTAVITNTGGGTITIPAESKAGALMKDAGLWTVLQCLSAVGNYQFDIYAQPLGFVRQSFQASANDYELQNTLNGTVIEKRIEDPLCYTQAHCQKVADFELSIVMAQRNRIKISKIAHLQDEPGDVIQFQHPYNKLTMNLLITDITRRLKLPTGDGKDGEFIDEVEGWKV